MAFCKGFSHPWFMDLIQQECRHCISLLPCYTVSDGFALIDSPEMSAIQLEHLFNLGYRKIGYIHNVDKPVEKSFVQQSRLLEYYRIMAEHGLEVKPEWVFSGYCSPDIFADRMNLLMKNGAEAVIVAGSFIRVLYETLQNQLYTPGRDLGIFCCDEINGLPEPAPTTVTNSPKAIIQSAWQLLQDSLNGAAPRIEHSRLRIMTGKTLNFCASPLRNGEA
jgi:DNA-binding LacI/PurR family transcriptional regulator